MGPLERAIQGLRTAIAEDIGKFVIDIVDEAQTTVILYTPLDTGRAKGNWFVSVRAPVTTYDWNRYSPSGASQIAENRKNLKNWRPDDTIYIRNNLPYIEKLNRGGSQQAPAAFVEKSVLAAAARGVRSGRIIFAKTSRIPYVNVR
jgi:hypothetical protein